jgi:hypothetical protein
LRGPFGNPGPEEVAGYAGRIATFAAEDQDKTSVDSLSS